MRSGEREGVETNIRERCSRSAAETCSSIIGQPSAGWYWSALVGFIVRVSCRPSAATWYETEQSHGKPAAAAATSAPHSRAAHSSTVPGAGGTYVQRKGGEESRKGSGKSRGKPSGAARKGQCRTRLSLSCSCPRRDLLTVSSL